MPSNKLTATNNDWLIKFLPIIMVVAGSFLAWLPFIAARPILPPIALMLFLSWRFLHSDIWPIWAGLALGLVDDVISGNHIGFSMFIWTILLFGLIFLERRQIILDWIYSLTIGWLVIIVYLISGWWLMEHRPDFYSILPQLLLSLCCYPLVLSLCLKADNWRVRQ